MESNYYNRLTSEKVGMKNKRTTSGTRNPCSKCDAICCRYVAVQIDNPTTPTDFEDIRWYISHRKVWAFVEDGDWYVSLDTPCKFLSRDRRCAIYANRPKICRKYTTHSCEFNGDGIPFDLKFTQPREIQAYAENFFREKRAKARARYRRLRAR